MDKPGLHLPPARVSRDRTAIDSRPASLKSCRHAGPARRTIEGYIPLSERDKRLETHAERLRMNPQIAALPPETVTALARHTRLIRFESGDRVHSRGDEIRYAGVIVRGGIRSSLNGYDGHELSISILRRGAFYGWMGILEPTPSPWDIYAHGPTEFACLFCSDFRAVMKDHPALLRMLTQALSLRLRRAYDYMTNLVLDDQIGRAHV